MPESIKDHSSHDSLLVCLECHHEYEPKAHEFKLKYVREYGIPIEGAPYVVYQERRGVVSACKALLSSNAEKIPAERKDVLINAVKEYYQVEEVSEDILRAGRELILMERGPDFREHGDVVMSSMSLEEMVEFAREWRRNFLEHAKPKFLSPTWKVENDVIRQ